MTTRTLFRIMLTVGLLIGISTAAYAQPEPETGTTIPVMTQEEIDGLVNPVPGFIVFNSTTGQLMCNFGAESPLFLNLPGFPPAGSGVGTQVAFWTPSGPTNQLSSDADLFWDNVDKELGVGTTGPNTSVDIDGGLSVRPPTELLADEDDEEITVGNRSYLRIDSDGSTSSRDILLSDGLQTGQILIIECTANGGDGIRISENSEGHNVEIMYSSFHMREHDTMTLIWNGNDWVELARSHNSGEED